MADVGSLCNTEIPHQPRNFCWKLKKGDSGMCLEKHTAPDGIQFVWDNEQFPLVTKKSVLTHGQYCQSGIAFRNIENPDIAECVSIDQIQIAENAEKDAKRQDVVSPYPCVPNGSSMCNYMKNGELYFQLQCECGLAGENKNIGYCPLPESGMIKNNIKWMTKMWIGDNCHTYDRANFEAQLECGIRKNYFILANATQTHFNLTYFPFV